jgi:hypothetical protein
MERAKNLVCETCWDACFSTKEFKELCQNVGNEIEVDYISSPKIRGTRGCAWCELATQVDERSKEMVPFEFRENSADLHVRFRTGIFHENYTPAGNNRFNLWVNGVSEHLTAFTDHDSVTSDIVTARPISTDVTSDIAYELIDNWLHKCASHPACGTPRETHLPTRVIEVSSEHYKGPPRLLVTHGTSGKYIALSYCWGGKQLGMTTSANIASRLLALDLQELSHTVRDAIRTTQRLGIRYLWVDALCIIQNSEDDRIEEIKQMCDIYRRAYITIVAASAAQSSDGFLQPRPTPVSALEIPFWSKSGVLGTVWVRPEGWYDDSSEPINSRCWTLQERLLSPRLIVYASHTVQLQCRQGIFNLGDSLNIPAGIGSCYLASVLTGAAKTKGVTRDEAVSDWRSVIMLYSERTLKRPEEKLVALSGLAQAFSEVIQAPYLAGLWSVSMLPSMLLWEVSYSSEVIRYNDYIAPTWSWISLGVPVSFRGSGSSTATKVEVLSASTTLKNRELPFGKVSAGTLVLKANIREATFLPPNDIKWRVQRQPGPKRPPPPRPGIYSSDVVLPDFRITANLSIGDPSKSLEVTCLALISRRHQCEGEEYKAVDGLLIEKIDGSTMPPTYQRVGCFFGAMDDEFEDSAEEVVALA